MSRSNFTEDFKRDAVHQITEREYRVSGGFAAAGGSQHSGYEWKNKFSASNGKASDEADEVRRLEKELARVTEARDILKSGRVFCQGCKAKDAFIALHRLPFSVRTMCRLLRVHPSGFYAWLKNLYRHHARPAI